MRKKLRKPLYGEALVTYSTKLRLDQIESLRKISNAAELMRAWVERGLAEEHAEGAGSFMLARKITALEREKAKLQSADNYERARAIKQRGIEYYSSIAKLLDNEDCQLTINFEDRCLAINKGKQKEELMCSWTRIYCPGWNWFSLKDFLEEHDIKKWNPSIPRELQLVIVNRMIEAYPTEMKALEPLEAEVTKLETELQKLRQKASGHQ